MPTTDLSIAPPSSVSFDWYGWSEHRREDLIMSIESIIGVTATVRAGGDASLYVHFDPGRIERETLIAMVSAIADQILPGHDFPGR